MEPAPARLRCLFAGTLNDFSTNLTKNRRSSQKPQTIWPLLFSFFFNYFLYQHPVVMDIFSRLNPFHRPNSAMSRNTPTPFSVGARPSSSLENGNIYPAPEATPNPSVEVYCRGGQLSHHKPTCNGEMPTMPKDNHHRSQSLLRNLAHHSSLSALTSKSTRGKRKGKEMKGIHLMPGSSHPCGDGGDAKDSELQRRLIPTFGTGKLKKGTLKPSKSLPRNLRLSEEFQCKLALLYSFKTSTDLI